MFSPRNLRDGEAHMSAPYRKAKQLLEGSIALVIYVWELYLPLMARSSLNSRCCCASSSSSLAPFTETWSQSSSSELGASVSVKALSRHAAATSHRLSSSRQPRSSPSRLIARLAPHAQVPSLEVPF